MSEDQRQEHKRGNQHWIPQLDDEPQDSPSLQVDTISRTIIILAIGIILGVAVTSIGLEALADKLDDLVTGFISLVVVIGILSVWIVANKNRLLKRIFGVSDIDLGDLKGRSFDLINNFSEKNYGEAEKNVSYILSKVSAWYVWFNFRRWILIVFQALFIGFGGLLGTILLFRQNLLIEQQTKRLDKQNELMENQNERMDQQTYLQEADRRSALVFRMDNTWNEVDRELKLDVGRQRVRDLSPELITRIVTLCEMLRPYRYLQGGVLSKGELSQERGQVLISLANIHLDTNTMKAIFEKGNFRYADLSGVNFRKAYLKGVSLSDAALQQATLQEANLEQALLTNARLHQADLVGAKLNHANLEGTDLSRAVLENAQLQTANLSGARLQGANLRGANLSKADLTHVLWSGADLRGARLDGAIVHDTWEQALSEPRPDSIIGRTELMARYALDTLGGEDGPRFFLREIQRFKKI